MNLVKTTIGEFYRKDFEFTDSRFIDRISPDVFDYDEITEDMIEPIANICNRITAALKNRNLIQFFDPVNLTVYLPNFSSKSLIMIAATVCDIMGDAGWKIFIGIINDNIVVSIGDPVCDTFSFPNENVKFIFTYDLSHNDNIINDESEDKKYIICYKDVDHCRKMTGYKF